MHSSSASSSSRAAPGRSIGALGALTQLANLPLNNVRMAITVAHLTAAVSPLRHLTRLSADFRSGSHYGGGRSLIACRKPSGA